MCVCGSPVLVVASALAVATSIKKQGYTTEYSGRGQIKRVI